MGLTYGINSSVQAMEDMRDGCWTINGTFAPSLLPKGIDETTKMLDQWATEGVSEGSSSIYKMPLFNF